MGAWNYKRYGTADDPIHKSHLNDITGDYGCPKQFRYKMDERATGVRDHDDEARGVSGKAACGTAAHETIARALSNLDMRQRLLAGGGAVEAAGVRKVFEIELAREVGARTVQWYDDDRDSIIAERVEMIVGVLNELHNHVHSIELVEAGFIVKLGDYWLSGHVDLVYRPKHDPSALGLADWKTGASKPDPIELDHGWEAGVYSSALHSGHFLTRDAVSLEQQPNGPWVARCGTRSAEHASRYIAEREVLELVLKDVARAAEGGNDNGTPDLRAFEQFPANIHHVHLADYVPYRKAGKKEVKRPEDLSFYGYAGPQKHSYVAGDRRGPAWLPVRRTELDIPRLQHRLRNIVGMIRLGKFVDQVGEKCKRCPWADDCLNSGYAVQGGERTRLERSLRVLGSNEMFDGLT